MYNIKLIIAYDGTRYYGWQQTRMGPSIENELRGVLSQILQENVQLQAASRTDAGVHASGQVANFFTSRTIDLQRLKTSVNRMLPKDIALLDIAEAPAGFHPTLDCRSKEYHYYLCYDQHQMPQQRHFSWHYSCPLDLPAMQAAAQLLLGQHDFSSFCNFRKNQHYEHYVRQLFKLEITQFEPKRLRFEIKGNHFLYKMVRNLVGTLAYVGAHKIPSREIPSILESRTRIAAGITAPAHGLFLYSVNFT